MAEGLTTVREEKTTDMTVSMRHIARHVKGLRENDPKDSKHCKPCAYLEELTKVIVASMSLLEDVAYIMRQKGMNIPENLNEGLGITLKEAKSKVFHHFEKTDFDTANKIRFYLNSSNHPNVAGEFSEAELQLQFNVLKECCADAFAAQLLYAEKASEA